MGRNSALTQLERRTLVEQRSAAIEQMNSKLRRKFNQIEKMFTDSREQNLRFYHQLGRKLIEIREDPDGYGQNATALVEQAMQIQARTLRKARAFAETYSEEELEELIALTDEETGFRLHWGHMTYLLSVRTKQSRDSLARKAVRECLDPPALHAEIKRRYPNRGVGGGRPHRLPPTMHLQIRQMMTVLANLVAKRSLWNNEDDELNVFVNIMNAPPDGITDADRENLQEIQRVLPGLNRELTRMAEQIDQCCQRVDQVYEQRARDQEEANRREIDSGREHRSIDLNSGGKNRKKRATASA